MKLVGGINQQIGLLLKLRNGIDNMEGEGYYKTIHLVICEDDMVESFEGEVR